MKVISSLCHESCENFCFPKNTKKAAAKSWQTFRRLTQRRKIVTVRSSRVKVKAAADKASFFVYTFADDLMRGISELTDLVKSLQKELMYQNAEIKHTQTLITSCAACQIVDAENCHSANPCFPGKK